MSPHVHSALHEVVNGKSQEYAELDGSASYQIGAVLTQYRTQGYNFGTWYPVYDWAPVDGYNNFSTWVG
jgi:hypothetical protein